MSSKRKPRKGKLKSKRRSKVKLTPQFATPAEGAAAIGASKPAVKSRQARYTRAEAANEPPAGAAERRGGLSGPAVAGLVVAAIGALFVYSEVHRRACIAGQINRPADCFGPSSSWSRTEGFSLAWGKASVWGKSSRSTSRGGFGRSGGGRGGGG